MMAFNMLKVAVSGYFNPIHKGHIDLFRRAKEFGDYLIVIVNNDKQRALKGSREFQDENERVAIVSAIKYVDEVFLSVDEDRTVCKSLEAVNPDVFANGGDRLVREIPEAKVCRKLGIKLVDGLGHKIQSSSSLLERLDNENS
jgi:cytidyltransferase-like protein